MGGSSLKIIITDLTENEAEEKVRELMLMELDTMSVTYYYCLNKVNKK